MAIAVEFYEAELEMLDKGKQFLILTAALLLMAMQLSVPIVAAFDPDEPPPAQKRMPIEDKVQVIICHFNDTTPDKYNGGYFHPRYIVSTVYKICINNPTNGSYSYHFDDGLVFYLTAINKDGKIVWRYPDGKVPIDKTPVDIQINSIQNMSHSTTEIGAAEWKDQPSGDFYIWPTLVGYNVTRLAAHQRIQSDCDFFGCTFGVDSESPVSSIPSGGLTVSPPDRTTEKATLGTTIVGTIAAIGFVASTEAGRYSLIGGLVPLYTRLKKNKVLDHFTRGQMHGYILANPGAHMNVIKQMFHVNNGVIAYHLKVLEREGYVRSRRDGLKRRFYPGTKSESDLQDQKKFLTEVQSLLISHIKKAPGINQKELADLANMSNQVVNYHIKKLVGLGVVVVETEGRATKCFIDAKELKKYTEERIKPASENGASANVA